jgi:hypothetical protein
MEKTNKPVVLWKDEPNDSNYPAAESYLSLIFPVERAKRIVRDLKSAPLELFKAKDILRASGHSLLDRSNFHVEKNTTKITVGKKLSPILLYRYEGKVIIADGWHRVCSVYHWDEDSDISVRIV